MAWVKSTTNNRRATNDHQSVGLSLPSSLAAPGLLPIFFSTTNAGVSALRAGPRTCQTGSEPLFLLQPRDHILKPVRSGRRALVSMGRRDGTTSQPHPQSRPSPSFTSLSSQHPQPPPPLSPMSPLSSAACAPRGLRQPSFKFSAEIPSLSPQQNVQPPPSPPPAMPGDRWVSSTQMLRNGALSLLRCNG
jgi:hypothetical protein